LGGFIADSFLQLFRRQVLSRAQIGTPQISALKIGSDQPCPDKVGAAQIGVPEVRAFQVRHREVGPAKNGPAEVGQHKVCVPEVGFYKIRADVGVFRPPLIPFVYVSEKRSNMFGISHVS
jgi:hypothetical protein